MLQTIKNIFGGYKKQINALQFQLQESNELNGELEHKVKSQSVEISQFKAQLDHHNSIEPWFVIEAKGLDPIRGIKTNMDWNDAFIQYLKDSGFKDGDEFLAIQKWILILHEDTISKIEDRLLENSTLIKENQFT